MLVNLLISIIICYTLTRFSVIIHELGHLFALSITRKKLSLNSVPLCDNIIATGLYGKTFSPIYFYLKKFKYKKEIQKIIKFNAAMGLIFEFVFLFIIIGTSIYFLVTSTFHYLSLCTSIYSSLLILFTIIDISNGISDIRTYKNPKSFTYKDTLKPFKKDYIELPIGIFCLSSVIAFIFST